MSALNAATAPEVVHDLGTLLPADRPGHGAALPSANDSMRGERGLVSRLVERIERWAAERRLEAELARLSDHMLADLGLDRSTLKADVARRIDSSMHAARHGLRA